MKLLSSRGKMSAPGLGVFFAKGGYVHIHTGRRVTTLSLYRKKSQ